MPSSPFNNPSTPLSGGSATAQVAGLQTPSSGAGGGANTSSNLSQATGVIGSNPSSPTNGSVQQGFNPATSNQGSTNYSDDFHQYLDQLKSSGNFSVDTSNIKSSINPVATPQAVSLPSFNSNYADENSYNKAIQDGLKSNVDLLNSTYDSQKQGLVNQEGNITKTANDDVNNLGQQKASNLDNTERNYNNSLQVERQLGNDQRLNLNNTLRANGGLDSSAYDSGNQKISTNEAQSMSQANQSHMDSLNTINNNYQKSYDNIQNTLKTEVQKLRDNENLTTLEKASKINDLNQQATKELLNAHMQFQQQHATVARSAVTAQAKPQGFNPNDFVNSAPQVHKSVLGADDNRTPDRGVSQRADGSYIDNLTGVVIPEKAYMQYLADNGTGYAPQRAPTPPPTSSNNGPDLNPIDWFKDIFAPNS